MEMTNKNIIVMKLIHYFITEKNYNPIILQGIENEIWLENMIEDYKVIRIVSGYIHNKEQLHFDKFKTKRIVRKIKRSTFTFNINVLNIYLDLGENISLKDLENDKKNTNLVIDTEKELEKNKDLKNIFPNINKTLEHKEQGMELFMKITNDINKHNEKDSKRIQKIFSSKVPYITYIIMLINVIIFLLGNLTLSYDSILRDYAMYYPAIAEGQIYRLFTAMFLHADLLHLAFNTYALYIIGKEVESLLGKAKFLTIYLVSGLFSSLLSSLLTQSSASVGASGAIFGLLGALLVFGFYYRVYLGNTIKSEILPIIFINLAIGFMIPGIDNFGHIGGLLGGILITKTLGIDDKSKKLDKINSFVIMILTFLFLVYLGYFYQR